MASKEKTKLQWQKEASQIFEVGFGELTELIRAKTALENPQVPIVQLHELTTEFPETWTDRSGDVTFTNVGIVDDVELLPDDTTKLILTDGAVQFTVETDPQGDPPLASGKWSFLVVANRADDNTLQVAERAWVDILP